MCSRQRSEYLYIPKAEVGPTLKKIALLLIGFAVCICAVFGFLYRADLSRMANNEPVIFSTWGYDYAKESEEFTDVTSDALYMTPVEGTVTSRGMVIDIVNNGYTQAAFGDYYSIEKRSSDKWKRLNYTTTEIPDWNDMAYVVESGDTMQLSFYWADLYGELDHGDYRLVKLYIDDSDTSEIQYLYCYFSL